VPARPDFEELAAAVDGPTFGDAWGYGGYAYGSSMDVVSSQAYYWSSTESSGNTSYAYYLVYYSSNLYVTNSRKYYGLQVRCVK
jgi:uncharacterized protein (TIGR02145 family)